MSKVKKVIIAIGSFLAVCDKILKKAQEVIQTVLEVKEKTEDVARIGKEVVAILQDAFGKKPVPCAGMA